MSDRVVGTEVIPPDDAGLRRAADAIRAGQLVAFPTETVYGIGANALDARATAMIFEAKGRPTFDPLIVHLAHADDLERYALEEDARDERVQRLARTFWPGPLTMVLRKRPLIPSIVTAGLDTVGLRVPAHDVAHHLLVLAGVPIAAPSANRYGAISPTRAEHVVAQLGGRVPLVLDGGPTLIGVESTVVLLAAGRAVLLRPGGVPVEAIEAEIGPLVLPRDDRAGEAALAPGRQPSHYAPRIPVEIVAADVALPPDAVADAALLALDPTTRAVALSAGARFVRVEVLAPAGDLATAASRLFDSLHRLDASGARRIVAQAVPETGLGRAIMDRLRRAAAR